MSEGREEKHTPEQLLNLYPALTKLLAYISGTEKVAITLAMEEYSREQLKQERNKALNEALEYIRDLANKSNDEHAKAFLICCVKLESLKLK